MSQGKYVLKMLCSHAEKVEEYKFQLVPQPDWDLNTFKKFISTEFEKQYPTKPRINVIKLRDADDCDIPGWSNTHVVDHFPLLSFVHAVFTTEEHEHEFEQARAVDPKTDDLLSSIPSFNLPPPTTTKENGADAMEQSSGSENSSDSEDERPTKRKKTDGEEAPDVIAEQSAEQKEKLLSFLNSNFAGDALVGDLRKQFWQKFRLLTVDDQREVKARVQELSKKKQASAPKTPKSSSSTAKASPSSGEKKKKQSLLQFPTK
jgi:hypothetical protein